MNKSTIVQHNDLIESSYQLGMDEIRLISLALIKIDSRKANVGIIEIYPHEFSEKFNLNKKNIWRNMKNSLDSIMKKPVRIQFLDANGKKKNKIISWLSSAEYYTKQCDGSRIELNFTDDIAPYLFELKGNYTKINFEYASRLQSHFSFRLYQWLTQEFVMKSGGYYELTLPLDTLKKRAGFSNNAYPQWRDFKSRIIQPAIDMINNTTNLSVNYDIVAKSKKVYALTFIYIDELERKIDLLKRGNSCILPAVKPIRPMLSPRPKSKAGSHKEGEWQKKNLKLLSAYLKNLIAWDSTAKLTMADLRKIVSYSKIFDPALHKKMKRELLTRQKRRVFIK